MSEGRLHRCWRKMQERCHDPKHRAFPWYGERGIRVCERWRGSFEAFAADMGPHPGPEYSIDRIRVDGDYAPGNCRWATRLEQARNRRNTMILDIGRGKVAVVELATQTGLTASGIRARVRRGVTGPALAAARLRPPQRSHCQRGHSLVDAYVEPDGSRQCRTCRRNARRRFYLRERNEKGVSSCQRV